MWSPVSRQIFLAVFILMGCGCALAQLFPGRITGTIRDIQGAVIVGATVTLTAPEIGLQRSTVSDPEGYFNFPELPLSTFELKVAKDGFQTSIRRGIVTYAGQVNDVAVVLPVGTAASEVKVTEDLPLLQTETNTVGGQLTTDQITQLPVSNEDYTRLALVMPGVTQNTNFAFSNFTVNGGRSRSSSFNVDGAANTDPYIQLPSMNQGGNSATAATRLPPDAIQEVQLVSHASAEYGQSSGGVMNALMKSGTNSLHGTIYEQHRDASLDAHNFFENLAGNPKAPFVWNNFGASGGGPLWRDHTFIFGAYDGSRLSIGTTFSSRAPTQAQIDEATSLVGTPNQLGLNILQLYQPLEGAFVVANRGKQTPNNGVLKVDHRVSSADSLSARYLIGDGLDEFPVGGPGPGGGSQLEKYFGVTPTRVHNFAISEVNISSPNLLNTIRLGYNRFHQAFTNQDVNFDPASIGLITGSQDGGLPEIDVGSVDGRFVNLGTTPGFPSERHDATYQFVDDISSTHRAHSLKLGINYFHNHSFGFNDNDFRGILTFDGSRGGTSLTTDGGVAGLVDLLSGEPAIGAGSSINKGATRYDLSQNIFSAYVTDTYRVRSNFTLIAGLRYDVIGVPSEDNHRFSNFLPSRGLVPVDQLPDKRIYQLVKTNFAPRIAFSWSLFPSHSRQTVIRGGYGIFYDVTPLGLLVGEGLNLANTNPGLATNPIGSTGVFGVSAVSPIDEGVPVFPARTPHVAAQLLYFAPESWAGLRRGTDFYPEGTLVWLAVDTLIRQQSEGRRSLDDFCRQFHGGSSGRAEVRPYTFDDLTASLNQVAPYDWKGFFHRLVSSITVHAPMEGIETGGWKLAYSDRMPGLQTSREHVSQTVDLSYSLGLLVKNTSEADHGKILDVLVGSPAEKAGVGPGMRLVAVQGRKWSPENLREAVQAATQLQSPIELLVQNGDFYKTVAVDYHQGERYPHLERDPAHADLLSQIIRSRSAAPRRAKP